jgi:CRP/FNR family transcriptional regulator, cyclic AMP receptor protein
MKTVNMRDKSLMDVARNITSVLGVPKSHTTDDKIGVIIDRTSEQRNLYHIVTIKKFRDTRSRNITFSLEVDEGKIKPRKSVNTIKIEKAQAMYVMFPNVMVGEDRNIVLKVVDSQGATKQYEFRRDTFRTHGVSFDSDKPVKQVRKVKKGDCIFVEGDVGEEMFIVLKGKVGLYMHPESGDIKLAELGSGSFFGEMALLGKPKRTASAIAETEVQVIVISKKLFEFQLSQIPSWFVTMFKTLISRLDTTNIKMQDLKDRLSKYEDLPDEGPQIIQHDDVELEAEDDVELVDEDDDEEEKDLPDFDSL